MSALFQQLDFIKASPPREENNIIADIPKELDIFYRDEEWFLPEGKTFADLTEQEKADLRQKYRFSPMRPGIYQTLSGFQGMI